MRRTLRLVLCAIAILVSSAGVAQADPPTPPPWLTLANASNGLCLTGSADPNDWSVWMAPCSGDMTQKWQTEPIYHTGGRYLMNVRSGLCLANQPGTSFVSSRPCSWKVGRMDDATQHWWYDPYAGRPTTFQHGWCLGVVPNSSLPWLRDCNSGASVLWYY